MNMRRLLAIVLLGLLPLRAQTTSPDVTTYSAKVGQAATFTASCSGTAPFTYQWYRVAPGASQGVAIAGATSAVYTIKSLTLQDAGTYYVTIANQAGQATSSGSVFVVSALPPSSIVIIVSLKS